MTVHDADHDDRTFTRTEATKFLSVEFVIGILFQTVLFVVLGGVAWGQLKAEVAELRSDQAKVEAESGPTPERMARIEEQLKNISATQGEFKSEIRAVKDAVSDLRSEVRKIQ